MSPLIRPEYPDYSVDRAPMPPKSSERLEELNPHIAVLSAAFLLLALPLAFGWHRFQVYRNADKLLRHAENRAAEENWREAATMYFHYLKLNPDDAESWVRLAQTFDRAATKYGEKKRAVELYFQTIALARDQADLRRRLAELLLETGKHQLAEYQADQLLEKLPEDPSGWRTKALSSYWSAHVNSRLPMKQVAQAFTNAAKYNPHDVVMARSLADIYRRELHVPSKADRESYADAAMDRLVAANPNHVEALLSRYTYRVQYRVKDADGDLDRAIELAPNDLEVLVASAHRAVLRHDYSAAQRDYQRIMEMYPTDRRGYLGLGHALAKADQREDALAVWRKGLTVAEIGPTDFWLNLRITETLIVLGRLAEASEKLGLLDDQVYVEARKGRRSQRVAWQNAVDFLRARWFSANGDFQAAGPVLQRVLIARQRDAETDEDREGVVEVLYQLAQVYTKQQQHDLAAAAFEDAQGIQPTVAQHYYQAAQAWESAGQMEKAARAYELGMAQQDFDPKALVLMARSKLARQQNLPPGQQDWSEFESALELARESGGDTELLRLLEADYLSARGKRQQALDLLEEGVRKHPNSERMAQGLIMANAKWGRPEEAERLLEKLEEKSSRSYATTMLRVALLVQRGDLEEARRRLEEGLPRWQPTDRAAAQFQLAQLELRSGKTAEARERLRRLQRANSRNVVLVQLLAELALEYGDWPELEEREQQLRDLTGAQGAEWRYFRARRLLSNTTESVSPHLDEARRLQEEVQQLRPSWAEAQFLRGLVDEQRGAADAAIDAYEQAVHLGFDNLHVYQRLIALLQRRGRIAEADHYLARTIELASYLPQMSTLAITVSCQHGQLGRAVELAQKAVELRPADVEARLWLGRSLLLASRDDEAEVALEKANQIAPQDQQTWIALIAAAVHREQPERVRALLARLAEAPLPEGTKSFLTGQALELLHADDEAETAYRRALELAPEDDILLRQTAAFFQRRDPKLAETLLRKLVDVAPDVESGKRQLAMFLASAPGRKNWREIDKLLRELGDKPEALSTATLRDKAIVLVQRGGVDELREATQLLERVIDDAQQAQSEDRLRLAWLYEMQNNLTKAREMYRDLATVKDPAAAHVGLYAQFLIDHGYPSEATSYLTAYEKADPNGRLTVELRAKWLHASTRDDEIGALLDEFVTRRLAERTGNTQTAATYRTAAEVAEIVGHADAEKWHRKWYELDVSACTALANWLSSPERGRGSEAIALCLDAAERDPSAAPAVAAAGVLVLGQASAEDLARAEPLLAGAAAKFEQSAEVALWVGNVRYLTGKKSAALELYRRALRLAPDNVDAMSNLALLLSEEADGVDEAHELLERAMSTAGKTVQLLDSHALVLLRQGKASEAVATLRELTSLNTAGASVYFHLAAAEFSAGDVDAARKSLSRAKQMQLDKSCLTPGERTLLASLEKSLNN